MTFFRKVAAAFVPEDASPVLKQGATTLAFAFALYILLTVPEVKVADWSAVWAATGLIVLAVGFSVAFSTMQTTTRWTILIPVISLIAIGILRAGTGSIFASLAILPIVWIASEDGRRWVVLAVVVTVASRTLEFSWYGQGLENKEDITSVIFGPIVFGLAAVVINEVSRQNRKRIKANRELVNQRDKMLDDVVGYVQQLRENETRLQSAEQLARSVLDSATLQAVIGTNMTGLIDVFSDGAESILGLKAIEVKTHRHIYEFHDADELENRARELNYPSGATVLNPGFSSLVEAARLGGSEQREWTWIRDDGTRLPVHVAVTRRIGFHGETIGYIFVGTDITEQKEVSKLKDNFVGLVSHELRTPLSSILGYLELMREDTNAPLSEEQRQYLDVAERNAHRLLRLVGDLLFTAQVASDKFPIDIDEVDLRAVVRSSIESARPMSQKENVLLLESVPDEVPTILGDAVRLGQACDNLISNAIKFTPRGGTVKVTMSTTKESVVIAVKDTGMGIPADELAQLSSRFFRASTATRNAVQGVGLGLSITKAIVTSHQGQLDVESEVGVSTTFSITLPLPPVDSDA